MNRALIFGIGGFVGPYLARELQSHGYRVYGTDSKDVGNEAFFDGFYKSDILEKDSVKRVIEEAQPTHIINLAAISSVALSWKIPDVAMQVNVNGTLNIFNSCLELNIKPKILLIGSSEEYVTCDYPIDESVPLNSNNPYGISKIAQEQFAKIYREKYDLDIFCVRAFNHIGPGQRTSFVIPSWCKQVADIEKGLQKPVIKVGNLNVYRDFTDVRDVVRAYRIVIESSDSSQIYNIGSGASHAMQTLLDYIISFSTKQISVNQNEELIRNVDNKIICSDNSKIIEVLKWKREFSIFDSIKEIYDYYMEGKVNDKN